MTTATPDGVHLQSLTKRGAARVGTGIAGLDDVLGGGFPEGRLYLAQGHPGSGKTTLAIGFLLEGVGRGERTLYVTLSETTDELTSAAASHGWDISGVSMHDFTAMSEMVLPENEQSVFPRADVELGEVVTSIIEAVRAASPTRVVIDSLSELWLLAGESYRFRQQILALKQFFAKQRCTVLLLDDLTHGESDAHLQSVAHGVVELVQLSPEYGVERRRLRIVKLRGAPFRGGYHDYVIRTGGIVVFPRLVAMEHRHETPLDIMPSGVTALDALLGGGLYRGTSTVLLGPAGVGKSTLALQYARYAAKAGKKSAIFLFDEGVKTIMLNVAGKELKGHIEDELINLRQIDPAEISPGEFAGMVRDAAESGVELIVIDGLTGYLNAMPGDKYLMLQIHELTAYLAEMGVSIFLLVNQHGMVGPSSTVDVSFLGDTVILFRYFELEGEIKRALSVTKRRGGKHERTIRELGVSDDGVTLGEPLRQFRGLLTGVPVPIDPKGGATQ
jgi:circadian clock protein KaiC